MAAAHLEKLNDRQREAVEHGIGLPDGKIGGPLLIIAGAGSGKTNTLAHRVAHLIVNGASLMMHDDFPEYTGGAMPPPSGVTLHLQVDDTDAWYDRAVAAGAAPHMPPADMFWGDRYAQVTDPFGHTWSIGTPVKGEK